MSRYSYNNWRPYVPVAERQHQAAKKIAKMKKAGRKVAPVEIEGRQITTTFWGSAWNRNLEAYSDYGNRLPRGRTYVRNGSVMDLQIEAGRIRALVSGSELYKIDIKIKSLAKKRWNDIKNQCAGQIDSLVELLQGSISQGVMEIVTRKNKGLFPAPREISLRCSCPDWATMCKHVAATLYGVGARLDQQPELLFTLRGVDPTEMVEAAIAQPPTVPKPRRGRVLKTNELSSVFGIDIDLAGLPTDKPSTPTKPAKKAKRSAPVRKKPVKKKAATKKTTTRKPAKKTKAKKATAKKNIPKKKTSPREPAAKRAGKKTKK